MDVSGGELGDIPSRCRLKDPFRPLCDVGFGHRGCRGTMSQDNLQITAL